MTIQPPMDRLQICPSLQFSSARVLPCTTLQDIRFRQKKVDCGMGKRQKLQECLVGGRSALSCPLYSMTSTRWRKECTTW